MNSQELWVKKMEPIRNSNKPEFFSHFDNPVLRGSYVFSKNTKNKGKIYCKFSQKSKKMSLKR